MATIKDKIAKAVREMPGEAERFLRRAYPDFVTARRPASLATDVPVFMFHKVSRHVFEEQMEFLRVNGYRTLDLETYLAVSSGAVQLGAPAVLLTFDDGDVSWHRTAWPVLAAPGFHAVGFVVTSRLVESSDQNGERAWLTWPEVAEMQQSGVFDFQSHSHYHARVFVEPRLVDFFHPRFDPNPLGLDGPWIDSDGSFTNRLEWGTPIYEHAPRLGGRRRYVDDEGVRRACTEWVTARGERAFGEPGWRGRLRRVHRQASRHAGAAQFETDDQRRAQIEDDLERSRRVLEERLSMPVRHLC